MKEGILYGQALRLRRICNSEEVLDNRLNELHGYLLKRGFRERNVYSQFVRARGKSRESLLVQGRGQKRMDLDRIPLVMNFYPALSWVGKIVDSLWYILQASDDIRETFRDKPMVAFRRPRNLRDDLVKSRFKRHREENRGTRKCRKTRQIFKLVKEGDKFYDKGRTYINYSFDCDSGGVVYLIKCKKCLKLYVGSTITTFRTRFNNHKSMKREGGQRGIP